MMDAKQLRGELQSELSRILSFWIENTIDTENGGFVGELDNFNHSNPQAEKGAVLNARILWVFSSAHRVTSEPRYLETASRAFDYIRTHFIDPEHGGVFWTLDQQGNMANGRKQIYAIAFTIYAFAEYHRACGNQQALELAIELFKSIENHSFDPKNNGYLEALSQDWSPLEDVRLSDKDENALKTMNTHLHILEGYTNLLRVWDDDALRKAHNNLIEVFLDKIVSPNASFRLFFDEKWNHSSENISFGHDIEGSWLLHEAAEVCGDAEILKRVEAVAIKMAEQVAKGGVSDDFAVLEELHVNTGEQDIYRHWWPQSEGVVGFFNAFQLTQEERFLELAANIWNYTKNNILDLKNGEWFWKVDPEGKSCPDEPKVGMWKCPYHNGRACLEIMERVGE